MPARRVRRRREPLRSRCACVWGGGWEVPTRQVGCSGAETMFLTCLLAYGVFPLAVGRVQTDEQTDGRKTYSRVAGVLVRAMCMISYDGCAFRQGFFRLGRRCYGLASLVLSARTAGGVYRALCDQLSPRRFFVSRGARPPPASVCLFDVRMMPLMLSVGVVMHSALRGARVQR